MKQLFQTYQLLILIQTELKIKIGKLGIYTFPLGYYIYTGSAKNNLEARIERHRSKDKKIRWHIDYLLSQNNVKIIKVKKYDEQECIINQASNGVIFVPKFGSSDCRNQCGSHLKYIGNLDPSIKITSLF